MTVVRNTKLYTGPGLYIGRGSPYGNDWTHITRKTKAIHVVASVQEAVFCFTDWLVNGTDDRAEQYREALYRKEFHDKILICWCVNAAGKGDCHGLILAAMDHQMHGPDHGPFARTKTMKHWADKLNNARDKYAPRCGGEECDVHQF